MCIVGPYSVVLGALTALGGEPKLLFQRTLLQGKDGA